MKIILLTTIIVLLTVAINYLYKIEKIMEFSDSYDKMIYFGKMPDIDVSKIK